MSATTAEPAPTAASTSHGGLALVATDGSDAAIAAAHRALALLHPDLQLSLVTVIPPEYDPEEDGGGFEGPVMTQEQADREHVEVVAGASGALAATAAAVEVGTPSETLTSDRRPADALVALAQERGAAVIVIGHEQHGLLHELFTASVAERVVRKAHCPVLVVPASS